MENTLINILKNLGFNEYETKVYLACLELGKSPVLEIARKARIKRTTVYNVVNLLLEKGLLSKYEDEKGQKFLAEPPEKILDMLQQKEKEFARLLPNLMAITSTGSDIRPEVKFYQGKEGIKAVYEDIINTCEKGDSVDAYFAEDSFDFFSDYSFMEKRIAKGFGGRGIGFDSEIVRKHRANDKKELRQTKVVSKDELPIGIEKIIYKGKVALINFHGIPFGVIIKSPQIYKAEKAIFELLWKKIPDKLTSK
ncbi:MAG: helix-turn-helix domain-containing protein [Candidatus Pacebacteria bacterium]|nr:helix-turn-helix domain-containing protein [Candidatus Paceibacterota bacterium]